MKKPYIKKYGKLSKFTIWIVDGNYIRTNLDKEFTNLGHHYTFKFIPKNEFWLDKENKPGEERFYINYLLVENRLMFHGKSYKEASEKASLIEKSERNKIKLIKKRFKTKVELIKKIHKKLLKAYSKKVKIWIVNGELVRNKLFLDFTEGGHDKVYPFIPKNEIWIDDDVSQRERKFILLHELHERNLMCLGAYYDIDKYSLLGKILKLSKLKIPLAHRSASNIEYYCRHHPKELNKKIKQEIRKSLKLN